MLSVLFFCVGGDCEFCGRTEPFSVDVLKKDALEVNDDKLEHCFFFFMDAIELTQAIAIELRCNSYGELAWQLAQLK